jgi:phosphonopyruvate decarboxylase
MINCRDFAKILKEEDLTYFTGVPDSTFKDWISYLSDGNGFVHRIACNECEAVALGSGYHLATGKVPIVYMQNSGLGKTVNPLTSLISSDVYSIPMILMIGWRGEPGISDEPQHKMMGRIMIPLLETLGIDYEIMPNDFLKAKELLKKAKKSILEKGYAFAIIIKKNTFESYEPKNSFAQCELLKREDAIGCILDNISQKDVIISTTGKTSRELYECRKRRGDVQKDFLTVGSMGCSASIAMEIALQKKTRRVYCFDGDGSVLMQMGALSTIGNYKPKNFIHIIFDNKSYDSTGGQPTNSKNVDFMGIAGSCGYKKIELVDSIEGLSEAIIKTKEIEGPNMILVNVKCGSRKDLGRPVSTPIENKNSFIEHLGRLGQKEYFGEGSISKIIDIIKSENAKKIFLVADPNSLKLSGAFDSLSSLFNSLEYDFKIFSDFSPNPKIEEIEKGLETFEKEKYDLLVAIGGGSTIDVAKAIKLFYNKKNNQIVPLVAVPTTAGSGSEATYFIVYYENKKKVSSGEEGITLPEYVILDSNLIFSLPKRIKASCGMDAFSQAIESYWSINSTEESKMFAKESIKLILKSLKSAVLENNRSANRDLIIASNLSGKAINITKTTACHALSYPITSNFNVFHGHAVVLSLSEFLEFNFCVSEVDCNDSRGVEYVKKTINEIVSILGVLTINEAKTKILNLILDVGLETRLSDLAINKEDLLKIICLDSNPERMLNNPRKVSIEDIGEILHKIDL